MNFITWRGKELSAKNISLSDYVESGLTCFFQSNDTDLSLPVLFVHPVDFAGAAPS